MSNATLASESVSATKPVRRRPLPTLFDSSALITAAKFRAQGRLVIDHLLACCRVSILPEVKREVVDVVLRLGYGDAVDLRDRVEAGSIVVLSGAVREPGLETALAALALEDTDRAVIHAAGQWPRLRPIADDHRLFVTATRLDLSPVCLPDLVACLAQTRRLSMDVAKALLVAVGPRYAKGFVGLSQRRLEERTGNAEDSDPGVG